MSCRRRSTTCEPYVAQLALYRAVLAGFIPDKTIRAALVFTDGPQLIEVPAAAMDAAFGKASNGTLQGLTGLSRSR